MAAARPLTAGPPLPPDHLRSVPALATVRSRRSPLGRLASAATSVARWLVGPAASATARAAVRARDAVLVLAGIGLVATAGWLVAPALGLAAGGIGLLVLHWSLRPDGMVIPVERLVVMLAAARAGFTDEQILNPTPDMAAEQSESAES